MILNEGCDARYSILKVLGSMAGSTLSWLMSLLPLLVFDSPDDNLQKQNMLLESRKVTLG